MRNYRPASLMQLLAVLILFVTWNTCAHANEILVGAAEVDITPPIGFRCGGSYQEVISTGVHDPLFAKAVVFRQHNTAAAIVVSDFLTINQRMAQLYGIDGVQGFHTRKVSIPDGSIRGGLLTQASLLKITANGTTTSPVVRGTFMMTRLLGDPPPPPPPSVPAIEPDISGASTIREQLAQHRSVKLCASCHQKIDPPGFALESFDVMGALRTNYRALAESSEERVDLKSNGKPVQYKIGLVVDTSGELPDGSKFLNVNEFRSLAAETTPKVARNLLEQFIVYATGAAVDFGDRESVESMMTSLAEKNYGVRSMIHEIVQSDLFRQK